MDKSSKKSGMNFIVVEGIDGSGKSTQIRLILDDLESRKVPYRYIHFPRTDSPFYGEMIARFLRGDFGSANEVDPYLVALLYAGDRRDASDMITDWLNHRYLVILDRYVYSNIAFQCAKLPDPGEREKLRDWILALEYTHNKIPKPQVNILLDVPFSFTKSKLSGERPETGREYLKGLRDIHEEDLEFQKRVRDMYLWQAQSCNDLRVVNCVDGDGGMLEPGVIFGKVMHELEIP